MFGESRDSIVCCEWAQTEPEDLNPLHLVVLTLILNCDCGLTLTLTLAATLSFLFEVHHQAMFLFIKLQNAKTFKSLMK